MNENASVLRVVDSCFETTQHPKPAHEFLFNTRNLGFYKESILQGLNLVEATIASANKPFSGILPHELAPDFQAINLDESYENLAEALAEVEELYLKDAIYFPSP